MQNVEVSVSRSDQTEAIDASFVRRTDESSRSTVLRLCISLEDSSEYTDLTQS